MNAPRPTELNLADLLDLVPDLEQVRDEARHDSDLLVELPEDLYQRLFDATTSATPGTNREAPRRGEAAPNFPSKLTLRSSAHLRTWLALDDISDPSDPVLAWWMLRAFCACQLVEVQLRTMLQACLANVPAAAKMLLATEAKDIGQMTRMALRAEGSITLGMAQALLWGLGKASKDDAEVGDAVSVWLGCELTARNGLAEAERALSQLRNGYRNPIAHGAKTTMDAGDYRRLADLVLGVDSVRPWLRYAAAGELQGLLGRLLQAWRPESAPEAPEASRLRALLPSEGRLATRDDTRIVDLVREFDSSFDPAMQQRLCLGRLMQLGGFEAPPSSALPERLAEFVGTSWCRVVTADVRHELHEGLRIVEASRGAAEALLFHLENTEAEGDNSDQRDWLAYAAARWLDGAGRVNFRVQRHTTGRACFERAVALAVREGLWTCLPDLQSNAWRAAHDEASLVERVQANPTRVRGQFGPQIDGVLEEGIRRGLLRRDAAVPFDLRLYLEAKGAREFVRGLCSLFHNAGELLHGAPGATPADLDKALTWARTALFLAVDLEDGYRTPMAKGLVARCLSKQAAHPYEALELYTGMCDDKWERGRAIGRQNRVELLLRLGRLPEARRAALELADTVEAAQSQRGATGLDLDVPRYALATIESVLRQAERDGPPLSEAEARLRDQLLGRRLALVRGVREVVAVAQYKQAYGKMVEPVYRALLAAEIGRVQQGDSTTRARPEWKEDALNWVEEAAGRELLDLMHAGPMSLALDSPSPVAVRLRPGGGGATARRGGIGSDDTGRRVSPFTTVDRVALSRRLDAYEREMLDRPIPASAHDPEIGRRLHQYATNHSSHAVVRYFERQDGSYGAFVFRGAALHDVLDLDIEPIRRMRLLGQSRVPDAVLARALWKHLFEPLWPLVEPVEEPRLERLVIIPAGELRDLPLHIAWHEGQGRPLAAALPVCLAVSATTYVTRGRHLLAHQHIEPSDDLSVIALCDEEVSGRELEGLDWNVASTQWLGNELPGWAPPGLRFAHATLENVRSFSDHRPEFLVYAGHGVIDRSFGALGPALMLYEDLLTQFDIASRLRIPRNKLTLLGACVSGQGASMEGGEISGFLRAFIAAGAGAVGVTLWPVLDSSMVEVGGALLRRISGSRGHTLDLVRALYEASHDCCARAPNEAAMLEACPIALYL